MANTLHPFAKKIEEDKASGLPPAAAIRAARAADEAGFMAWLAAHTRQHGNIFAPQRARQSA